MVVGDLVAVWANDAGVPQRFEWGGHQYLVCPRPVPWVDRAPWWSMTETGLISDVEQQMWRVSGLDTTTGEITRVDLAVEEPGWWRLSGVQD